MVLVRRMTKEVKSNVQVCWRWLDAARCGREGWESQRWQEGGKIGILPSFFIGMCGSKAGVLNVIFA
jgi:hypothetical protein